MKLQNLSVIFIIIVIPLILVVSYYISLQVDTLNMQSAYNTKLLESTKEAIDAFEINTVEWNSDFSQTADSKRRDIMASINTFITSFANNIGVGGTSKEYISAYIPAIAYTLYDGYYIYAPTDTKQTIKNEKGLGVTFSEDLLGGHTPLITGYSGNEKDDKGKILYVKKDGEVSDGIYNGQEFTLDSNKASEEYKHILRPFKSYSEMLSNGVIINYTLDNYITVYSEDSIKSGYLTSPSKIGGITDKNISNITFEGQKVERELLSEKIAYYKGDNIETKTFNYIYEAENNTKIYYGNDRKFFRLNKDLQIVYIDSLTEPIYKKYSIPKNDGRDTECIELYQNLNDKKFYTKNNAEKYEEATETYGLNANCLYYDYSAINYCVESYVFTNWVNNLKRLSADEKEWLKITLENDPENKDSLFSAHKKEVIRTIVEGSLNQAITSYSRNSSGEYQLPELSETDWDQILTNVSITTFVQGMPIGLKYYDNYAIATSTLNKEYVDSDEIYLNASGDNYYHMPYCTHLGENNLVGYRSIDYVRKSYSDNDKEIEYYYFKHEDNSKSIDVDQACYYCLVERSQYGKNRDESNINKQKAYYTALLRERYNNRKMQ